MQSLDGDEILRRAEGNFFQASVLTLICFRFGDRSFARVSDSENRNYNKNIKACLYRINETVAMWWLSELLQFLHLAAWNVDELLVWHVFLTRTNQISRASWRRARMHPRHKLALALFAGITHVNQTKRLKWPISQNKRWRETTTQTFFLFFFVFFLTILSHFCLPCS